MEKLIGFGFAFLFLLISFVRSDKLRSHPLGGSCVTDRQCGDSARCTTAGKCRCPAGYLPETESTCTAPYCSSTEFCHTKVTANTVCKGYCRCQGPIFKQDPETFECVRVLPDSLPLGAQCKDSTYCGEGASCTTGSEQICKCKLGYLPTSDTVCEQISCSKDEQCHKRIGPGTYCYTWWGTYCRCTDGFHENLSSNECWQDAPNIGQPCAQKDDNVYPRLCGTNATCNNVQKCACGGGYEVDKDLPWQCQYVGGSTEGSTQASTEASTETSTESSKPSSAGYLCQCLMTLLGALLWTYMSNS